MNEDVTTKLIKTSIAVKKLEGVWPKSQECNRLLHYDWRNDCYYSDFYGENEYVELVCSLDEFIRVLVNEEEL